MNKQRKSNLSEVSDILDDAFSAIQDIIDEEQDAFDNLPESLQYSSKGDAMQDAIDLMTDWQMSIETISDKICAYCKH
jgi:hypothetical protein